VPRLRVRGQAQADLADIFSYIVRRSGNRAIANRFVDEFLTRCRELASLPGQMGRARPELGEGIRSRPHRGYVIFFRYSGSDFEVVRILEGHRDIEAAFAADPHSEG
jgi:toxin ParE1/3/4